MVLLDIYAAYILFNCVLSTVCLSVSLSLFVCVCVFCVFTFYGLKPEINAFIHSFIHSFIQYCIHGRKHGEEKKNK